MWFKVDDGLHAHRKTRAVRRSHRSKARDVAPFGLWVLAGSWCGGNPTEGFVPSEVLAEWDDNWQEMATRLIDAGLWWETTQDGEEGYGFHDWQDYVPAPEGIPDASESGRRGNHVRWHERRGTTDPECEFCSPDHRPDIASTSPRRRGDQSGSSTDRPRSSINTSLTCGNAEAASGRKIGSIAPSRPDAPDLTCGNTDPVAAETHRPESRTRPVPTRPDPTRPEDPSPTASNRFEEFWATYDHKVGRKKAVSAYAAALKKPGVTEDLLISSAAQYVASVKAEGKHPTYTKHPTTWLHGEHWNDERASRPRPQTRVQQHLALAEQLAAEESGPTLGELA